MQGVQTVYTGRAGREKAAADLLPEEIPAPAAADPPIIYIPTMFICYQENLTILRPGPTGSEAARPLFIYKCARPRV